MQKILLAPLPALVLLLLLTAVLSAAFAIVKILLLAFLLPGHFHANFLLGILAQNRPQSRQVLRRGIASALCGALEHRCPETRIYVHASKTSRPFFEARGYRIVRPQQVERRGQVLTNFVMEKELIGWT